MKFSTIPQLRDGLIASRIVQIRFSLSSSSSYYYPNPNLSYSNSTPLREIMATTLVSSAGGMLAMLDTLSPTSTT
ncbi:hypothetical protein GYH30_010194 [Glycine max]|uniref:Uncharacterized protein n=1 Tax=Glycine max TaxID=3847 RepID=A0A0R0KE28_SOYBN|nr:hypothetical protein GYH30_010194 [Glycine max]